MVWVVARLFLHQLHLEQLIKYLLYLVEAHSVVLLLVDLYLLANNELIILEVDEVNVNFLAEVGRASVHELLDSLGSIVEKGKSFGVVLVVHTGLHLQIVCVGSLFEESHLIA